MSFVKRDAKEEDFTKPSKAEITVHSNGRMELKTEGKPLEALVWSALFFECGKMLATDDNDVTSDVENVLKNIGGHHD
jgi:hypothetical protein